VIKRHKNFQKKEKENMSLYRKSSITKLVFLFCLFLLIIGCGGKGMKETERFPTSMSYEDSYDNTWTALLASVKKYPVLLIDKEKGVIHTDWYVYPKGKSNILREKCKLDIKVEKAEEKVKIDITSQMETQNSRIFRKWVPKTSNGQTEYEILKEVENRLKTMQKEKK
jgi:hypothetical protein